MNIFTRHISSDYDLYTNSQIQLASVQVAKTLPGLDILNNVRVY